MALLALNAFLEDTCVIVVIAYLLTRGWLFSVLVERKRSTREILVLGIIFGLIGMTEDIFPGARYPYVTETLVLTFATLIGGSQVGLVATVLSCIGNFAFQSLWQASGDILVGMSCLLIASLARRWRQQREALTSEKVLLLSNIAIGMVSQAAAVLIRYELASTTARQYSIAHAVISIPANGIGLFLLGLIVDEARLRHDSEQLRRESEQLRLETEHAHAEVEQARAMLAENQLIAVRARLHPHFLFNTLSSIAALCRIAPTQAEEAIVRLGELMRRALESDHKAPISLSAELDDARAYVHVQQMRLGRRLTIEWQVDPSIEATALVPPFSLLTLLENAVNHGIAAKIGAGAVIVIARPLHRSQTRALIAICDSGVGMTLAQRAGAMNPTDGRPHGLPLLAEQLRLLHGTPGRLRVFSRPDTGTLCVFQIPLSAAVNLPAAHLAAERPWEKR